MTLERLQAGCALSVLLVLSCDDSAATQRPLVEVHRSDGGARDGGGASPYVHPSQPGSGSGRTHDAAASTAGDAGPRDVDGSVAPRPECTLPDRPVDVIFVIDTSGSMSQEIIAIQNNINDNFARTLSTKGVDYRVVLIGRHGISDESELRICISEPLSDGTCAPVPTVPANNERFRHYSALVGSYDSLCVVLDSFAAPDEFGLAPHGWSEWLRPEALKVFIEVSDDSAACASATTGALFSIADDPVAIADGFDAALRSLSAEQFGAGERNFKFYSIVGLAGTELPSAPLQYEPCSTAPTPGVAYQALSVLTSAMRYPVCEGTSFPAAFLDIAGEVIDEALPCQEAR